jgi:peroxiredoxin
MKQLIVFLALAICSMAFAPVKNGYEVGDTAADFSLKNVDGKKMSLADFKTVKGYIVVFDCNTCPISQAYNSRIIALNKKYAPMGFPVIAINPNDAGVSPGDSFDNMVTYAKKKGYEHPYLADETQDVTRAFGATNTPHVYILSKERKVLYIGAIDNSTDEQSVSKKYVESAMDEILGGKAITTPKTKAVGCTVKWKNS